MRVMWAVMLVVAMIFSWFAYDHVSASENTNSITKAEALDKEVKCLLRQREESARTLSFQAHLLKEELTKLHPGERTKFSSVINKVLFGKEDVPANTTDTTKPAITAIAEVVN